MDQPNGSGPITHVRLHFSPFMCVLKSVRPVQPKESGPCTWRRTENKSGETATHRPVEPAQALVPVDHSCALRQFSFHLLPILIPAASRDDNAKTLNPTAPQPNPFRPAATAASAGGLPGTDLRGPRRLSQRCTGLI